MESDTSWVLNALNTVIIVLWLAFIAGTMWSLYWLTHFNKKFKQECNRFDMLCSATQSWEDLRHWRQLIDEASEIGRKRWPLNVLAMRRFVIDVRENEDNDERNYHTEGEGK